MADTLPVPPDTLVDRLRLAGCVFAEDEARLLSSAAAGDELEAMVARRVAGEPLEQVLGWAEFCGLRVMLAHGVFVPRRRTEALVDEAVARARPGDVLVDLCCGSGAVAAALADRVSGMETFAVDVDPAAVACARHNLPEATVLAGDLFAPLPRRLRGAVDMVVVNAPYVPSDEIALMPAEARLHEPAVALDGGPDGVDVHRRVAAEVRKWLRPGGWLLVETSRRQEPGSVAALRSGGLHATVRHSERVGGTVVIGRAPGVTPPARDGASP